MLANVNKAAFVEAAEATMTHLQAEVQREEPSIEGQTRVRRELRGLDKTLAQRKMAALRSILDLCRASEDAAVQVGQGEFDLVKDRYRYPE